MRDILDKFEQLRKALAAMKPKQDSIVPALKLPSIKPLSMPSSSGAAVNTKLPGVASPSGKDPKKMAEQLKNPRPKKPKIEMLKVEKNGQWNLMEKAAPDFRQPKTINFDRPHVDPAHPTQIHADHNGFRGNMNRAHPAQNSLIHGADLATGEPVDESTMTHGNKWVTNPLNNKTMIVKPASGAEAGTGEGATPITAEREKRYAQDSFGHLAPDGLNGARREVLTHNIAHKLRLGHYFPTTAGFTKNGEDYSAQEKVDGHKLTGIKGIAGDKKLEGRFLNSLKQTHDSGDMHKLAALDMLMGNNDRGLHNILLDKKNNTFHHIDHGRSVDYGPDRFKPSALLTHAERHGISQGVHPETLKWLNSLDEGDAAKMLENYVEPDSKFKGKFLERLHNLKMQLQHGKPGRKFSDMLSAAAGSKRRAVPEDFQSTPVAVGSPKMS
jgi:hypothetical protein